MIWKSRKSNRKEFGYIAHEGVENTQIAEMDKSGKSIIEHFIQTNNSSETSICLCYTVSHN